MHTNKARELLSGYFNVLCFNIVKDSIVASIKDWAGKEYIVSIVPVKTEAELIKETLTPENIIINGGYHVADKEVL